MSLHATNSVIAFDASTLVRFTIEKELRWSDIIKNISDGVFVTDEESTLVYINNIARRFLGMGQERLPANIEEFVRLFRPQFPDGRIMLEEDLPFNRVFQDGPFKNLEMLIQPRRSVHKRLLNFSGAPIQDARGHTVAAFCLARDQTVQWKNVQELELFNNAFQTIMDTTEVLNSSLDMKRVLPEVLHCVRNAFSLTVGLIYLLNEETSTLHLAAQVGLRKDEIEELAREKFDERISGKVALSKEIMIIENFGEYPHLMPLPRFKSAISLPLIVRDQIIGVVTLMGEEPRIFLHHDLITLTAIAGQIVMAMENARRYQSLLSQNEELSSLNVTLREVQNEKNEFLSLIAHDFRTPLAVIDNYARLMINETSRDNKDVQPLRIIMGECRRLNRLAGDTLALTRLESGEFRFDLRPVSLQMVIPPLVEEIAGAAPQCRIIYDIDPSIPLVLADMERIQEVLDNLITNAVKYSPVGGEVEVRVSNTREEPQAPQAHTRLATGPLPDLDDDVKSFICVTIYDQGIGIEQQAADKLFTKFYRVKTPAATGIKGTGLGLYICRKIVEGHGGRIGVYSTPGIGSCFYFTLKAVNRV